MACIYAYNVYRHEYISGFYQWENLKTEIIYEN